MSKSERVKSALLTKSELDWLLGNNSDVSKSYEYKMKSGTNLEFPTIQNSGIFSEDVTVFGKTATVYGKVANQINSSNIENCAQNMVGRNGLI